MRIQLLPGPAATGDFPPFWKTSTTNNLLGPQIGIEGKIVEYGGFSVGGRIKVGGHLNMVEQSTGVSIFKEVRPSSASTCRISVASEAGLHFAYHITRWFALKVGYEALWLGGVALAPGQIEQTYTTQPSTVSALGVHSDSSLFFHGATAGLVFSF